MALRDRVKHLLRMCGHAFFSSVHERLDAIERQARNASFPETQAALLQASIHTVEKLRELTDHVLVETNDDQASHPEIGLIEFLYSYLPTRKAVADLEASERLRAIGYEVCVLKPGQAIPEDAGLVMLETARESRCPVAIVAFRSKIETAVKIMRSHGYSWHIVLHRMPHSPKVAYYSNLTGAAADSRGSVFFFRDYSTFAHAQLWCSAVLPRTYFKPTGC